MHRFFTGKKLEKFNKLRQASPKTRKKEINKLIKKGDLESVRVLFQLCNLERDTQIIDALVKINNSDSLEALRGIYQRACRYNYGITWNELIETVMIDLRDYHTCLDIMFDGTSKYKDRAREIVLNHPNLKQTIKRYSHSLTLSFNGKYPSENITERDKFMLSRQHQEDIKNLIALLEQQIDNINEDQAYYTEYQPFGDDSNYDWYKAKAPRNKWLRYLRTLLK